MSLGLATIHPREDIAPGRYLLDDEGRLQPLRYRGFVRAVAVVTVKPKGAAPELAPEPTPTSEPDPEEPAMAEFMSALSKVRAARAGGIKPTHKVDGVKLAAAIRARQAAKPAPKPRPKRQALSGEPCYRCGVAGTKGCDHFLPYRAEHV